MKMRVLLFGVLAEHIGSREETIDVVDAPTVSEVVRAVAERYPQALPILERVSVAVNLEIASPGTPVERTDEVALLPPAAGGSAAITVGLRERPSVAEALDAVASSGAGGTAVFVGTVRDNADGDDVSSLEYSSYDAMAMEVMREIASTAADKWGLAGAAVYHAVGALGVGETTVVVACSAAHRDEAFAACRYVVDEIKERAPIWKKERGPWGHRWVNA